MAGDEVGMEARLDNVFDFPPVVRGRFHVDIDVPLGIDDGGDPLRGDDIGGMRQASQIHALDLYGFFAVSCG